MKRNFLVIALLFSILCWGVNAAAFAQNQDKKDTKIQEVKKDVKKKADLKKQEVKKDVGKKVDVKKDEMKKDVTKKVEVKKEGMKKDMMKKGEVKKEEMKKEIKKGDVKKDEMKKEVTSKKEVKDVTTVIKDKEVGKTADGKTIYEGPKGGKYTISENGKKVYIKKEAK